MTRYWTVPFFCSLLLMSPGAAFAQAEPAAESEKPAEAAEASDAAQPAAEEAAEAAAEEAEKKKPTEPATTDAPKPPVAPTVSPDDKPEPPKPGGAKPAAAQLKASASVTADASGGGDGEKKKNDTDDNTAVLGAAAPTPPPSPYQIFFTVGLQAGTGTFLDAEREQVGYTINLSGLYRLSELGDGRLDVFAVLNADQLLTNSSLQALGSVAPNEFFFRDVRVGLLGRSLLNEKNTGIIFGANTSIALPTGLQAQAQGRFLRWAVAGNAVKIFSGVGPGSLLLRASISGRWDISGDPTLVNTTNSALCRSISANAQGECFSGRTGTTFGLIPGFSMTYLWGDFNFALGLSFINIWSASATESTGTTAEGFEPGTSDFGGNSPYELLTSANLAVTYVANRYLNFTAGISTLQLAVTKCNQGREDFDDTGFCPTFPFFDFNSPADNLTSFYLNTTVMY